MKEIIRSGNGGIKIKYNNTCPYCQCEYTYEDTDVYSDYNLNAITYVDCPSCGNRNIAAVLPPLSYPYGTQAWFDATSKRIEENNDEQN